MDRGLAQERGLRVGRLLLECEMEELVGADALRQCQKAALRLLSYRPRSETEMRERLGRRFRRDVVEAVVLQLRQKEMVDDGAFATFWTENRQQFSPRSRRLLKRELRQKGIAPELIDESLDGVDDGESAYRAAEKRGRGMHGEYDAFRRKMGAFLGRRGFSYDVINSTVERVWRESRPPSSE